ncbi:hypothetical protein, conserved in T. vivax [Trypanosoma vivax Y486]|uniref:Uncharacterized protein n=1 Tax=Trypanosoma vivax (strain Y486) TaxID=1055687 RepID=F9WKV1_TRYVY|nr:hypothetical protein, conserved in T. vivax [Trypanosoma vivax Y486]|eukprot:CCD18131.1 hypothetical protein, conserved in T. vivax [Trypanosoma vivax Y486]
MCFLLCLPEKRVDGLGLRNLIFARRDGAEEQKAVAGCASLVALQGRDENDEPPECRRHLGQHGHLLRRSGEPRTQEQNAGSFQFFARVFCRWHARALGDMRFLGCVRAFGSARPARSRCRERANGGGRR